MSAILVVLVFGVAFVLAAFLLYRYHSLTWYWHALSLVVALVVGMMPGDTIPAPLRSYAVDLFMGFAVLFMLVWGIGGLLMYQTHREHHA